MSQNYPILCNRNSLNEYRLREVVWIRAKMLQKDLIWCCAVFCINVLRHKTIDRLFILLLSVNFDWIEF